MSISKRGASLLCSRRVTYSRLRFCSRIVQHRSISNDFDGLPTRYSLPKLDEPVELPSFKHKPLSVLDGNQCASCGIELQHTDEDGPGYCKMPEYKSSLQNQAKAKDIEFYKAYSKLDEEGRKLLQEHTEQSNVDLVKQRKLEEKRNRGSKKGKQETGLKCVRCYNALYHSKLDLAPERASNYTEVMDKIPPNAKLVHVASAYDFPLGLMNHNTGRNPIYAINKADLLFSSHRAPGKYGQVYFGEMIKRLTSSDFYEIVSANNQWNISNLLQKLPRVSYLVGFVNSGKTLLANKLRNRAISNIDPSLPWESPVGTSFIPALTRDNIEVDLLDKVTYDTPGFLPEKTTFDILKPEVVKPAMKSVPLCAENIKKTRYVSVQGGQCYTLGGIMYLIPPKGTILQVISASKGDPRVFRDLKKATEVIANQPKSIPGIFVKPETTENLIRYVIPPYVGKFDVLIRDYGYIQITPTGKRQENQELFEVWAPEGVVLGVRQAIVDYITHSTPLNKQGKKVKREHKAAVKRVVAKPIAANEKLFSRLYRVPVDCENTKAEMIRQYDEHIEKEKTSRFNESTIPRFESEKTKYWIEKLYE